ncbi:MAG: alpha/beta fold hydrolase [Myxococcales bacterium]|nr:alpha/beta fold hydrolase [Myxococcales bacterium]
MLRYEKRTREHATKLAAMKSLTIKEEAVDDAILAVALLRSRPEVEAHRVFLLGHSLGGSLAPRISAADPAIAGLVLLAASARPMEDAIVGQTRYLHSLDGKLSEEEKAQLEELSAQAAMVKSPELPADDTVLGVPGSYWLDLRGYDGPKLAASLGMPMLVLQGGRDYQVTESEHATWKQALSSRKDVTFKVYPELNHLFVRGQGKSTPQEYSQPGKVEEAVLEDVASFVKSH